MKVAICAGHHRGATGAKNEAHGINEYTEALLVVSDPVLQDCTVIHGTLSQKIAAINAGGFDLAIDLHFNAGGGRGCEVLYYPGNPVRYRQAMKMSSIIAGALGVRDRGAKAGWHRMDAPGVVDYPGDVDGDEHKDAFLSQTNCPAFILEPIFIDNNEDVERFLLNDKHHLIALALRQVIESFGKEV